MDAITETLIDIHPKTLDDIVRKNRDKLRIYASTEEELGALHAPVPIQAVTGVISHWSFLTLFFVELKQPAIHLHGYNAEERSSWMTSAVVGIHGNAVATRSGSLYMLDGEQSDEEDLEYICATLHSWGLGPKFDVPPFFF